MDASEGRPANYQAGLFTAPLLKNLNRQKQVKLNVYTPPNPDAPSVHTAFTFISRSQGFTAQSLHVLSLPTSDEQLVSMRVEEGVTLDCDGNYSLEGQEPDFKIKAASSNRWKRTTGDHPLLMWIKDQDLFLQELL
ncbi:hypothetical protein BDR07DRAFT_1487597 [Suillus spraguei]|nr:hypothetical protein BDR07DRAFT_1487597 [Suillus spraguei]